MSHHIYRSCLGETTVPLVVPPATTYSAGRSSFSISSAIAITFSCHCSLPSPSSIHAQPSTSIPSIPPPLSSLSVVQPLLPSPSPSLPPLPLLTPSALLVLSPTPTPLESSVEVSDVRTPSSFHMPTTSLSLLDDDEDSADEDTLSA